MSDITTICRDCVFAETRDNVQENCYLNRLEKFEENGGKLEGINDGKQTYVTIVGRFCNACRNQDWANAMRDNWPPKGSDKSINWMADRVRSDIRIRCDVVIYAETDTPMHSIEESVAGVVSQSLPPHRLTLAINNPDADGYLYSKLVKDMELGFPWQIRAVQPPYGEEHRLATYEEAIDETVHSCKGSHYTVFQAGFVPRPAYLERINEAINEDMMRFVAILPDADGNGLFVQSGLHKLVGGNKVKNVTEKLKEIAAEESTQHMIKTYGEIHECTFSNGGDT